ncbi:MULTISPECIES: hypothetical protein [unclassified Caballeronia]|uniref:hypothetical protein n=1 Tax=unclassified Caballeronia TaxID=2646786 RepID=UPI0028661F43|nr:MULTISPECIES: hypothetical protein [unclassified Caballeronia]MDR5755252.1 hypothetical protein [Caballeronia sp. LZ024]MDR5845377.1 hypothetical protein [Caballeronia sp. LZ031]
MSNPGSALVWVDAVAGGGRVEIYSREVSKADALRMFASASTETRAFKEDLIDWAATEIVGDVLYAGYFCPKSKGLDEEKQVWFALVHACDAISKHFGIDAGLLERALRPENLAELAAARDAEIASLVHELPELTKDAEAVREKHASVQAALADELAKAIADDKIKSH